MTEWRGSWWTALFLPLLAIFFLPGMYDGNLGKWALLYLALVVFVVIRSHIRMDTLAWCVVALVGWCALSLAWSSDWRAGLVSLLNIAVMASLFLLLRPMRGEGLAMGAAFSLPAVMILHLVWPETKGSFGNDNFATEYVLIATALMWGAPVWRWVKIFITIEVIAYLVLFNTSRLEYLWAVPLLPALDVVHAVGYRLELFAATGLMWLDTPLFGQGLGSFDYEIPRFAVGSELLANESLYAGAAHNEYLQLFAELGVVGGCLAFAFLFEVFRNWKVERDPVQCSAWVALVIAGVLSLAGFPLQNPATAFLVVCAIAMVTPIKEGCRVRVWPTIPIATAGVAYLPLAFTAQVLFSTAAETIDTHPRMAYVNTLTAHELDPFDPIIRHHLYMTAHNAGVSEAALKHAERVAGTAMPYHPRHILVQAMNATDEMEFREHVTRLQAYRIENPVMHHLRRHLGE